MTLLTLLPLAASAAPVAPVSALPSPPALAQEASADEPVHLFSFGLSDSTGWLSHPKDAGLERAFALLDDRLAELPTELEGQMPPELAMVMEPGSLGTILRVLQAQKRVSLFSAPPEVARQGQPVVFGVSIDEKDADAAARLHAGIGELLAAMNAPIPGDAIQLDGSTLSFGMGAEARPMGRTRAAAELGGGDLVMEMDMNVGGYLDFLWQIIAQNGAPQEAAMVFHVLERLGLKDMHVEVASSCDGRHSRTVSIATGITGRMKAAGMLPDEGVRAAHLAPIPADATWASVQRLDMGAALEALVGLVNDLAREQGMEDFDVAEMVASTGIDLRAGVIAALGDTMGMYASQSTGGGGATSTVMYMSLDDADALIGTRESIEDLLNGLIAPQTRGYVSVRSWSRGDVEYTTLMFPGIPIPLEPTIAISEGWLVVSATPQAALGAIAQIESGTGGLASDPRIAPLVASGANNSISFMDTEYYARKGYGATSLTLSALCNGVRSPSDAGRDPGPILPIYSEFVEGIAPTIGATVVRGDEFVTTQTSDGSTAVQVAALWGFVIDYAAVIVVPAAVAGLASSGQMSGF